MIRIVSVLMLVTLAGCSGQMGSFGNGEEVAIAGQGQMTGAHNRDIDCGSKAQIAVGYQGQGNIDVKVVDGAGAIAYSDSFSGQGQEGETKTLNGAEGNWRLTVTFTGLYGGYQGQYAIYLRC